MVKTPLSGWWNTGIPKYDDNPAMQEGSIPNTKILASERRKLKKLRNHNMLRPMNTMFKVEYSVTVE